MFRINLCSKIGGFYEDFTNPILRGFYELAWRFGMEIWDGDLGWNYFTRILDERAPPFPPKLIIYRNYQKSMHRSSTSPKSGITSML
jgi:hypothetical protein